MAAKDPAAGRPKVLVPEKVSPDGLALLQQNLEVHEKKGLTPEQLLEIIGEYTYHSDKFLLKDLS
jgi:D-3-phosphoglycerate dehydrogenase / 2-oxoglutarate reductase